MLNADACEDRLVGQLMGMLTFRASRVRRRWSTQALLHGATFPALGCWRIEPCNRDVLLLLLLLRARSRIQFYFSQQSQQLATAVALVTPLLQLATNFFSQAHTVFCVCVCVRACVRACVCVNPADRRPQRASCEFTQVFPAQIVASFPDRVARCNTSFRQLQQKHFSPLQVVEKIAQCSSAFTASRRYS